MTNEKKTPDFQQAVAQDWYLTIQNDLKQMTPGQLAVTEKALADFKASKADKSEGNFEKKINSMTDMEFARFKQDLNWEAAKKGNI